MLLQLKNISRSFDGLKAVDDFSAFVEEGTITGLIGPNGAGKTTLFNIITGFLKSSSGSIIFNDKQIEKLPSYKITLRGITRTFQDLRLIKELSVIENVLLFFPRNPGENIFNIYFRNKLITKFEEQNTLKAVELLSFSGLEDKQKEKAGNLSYGQQKLLSMCCCLAADPKLILLDEPVSGIQPASIEKISSMIKELVKNKKTILLIEHDMNFVFENCSRVVVMDHGKKIAEGSPADISADKNILEAYLD